MKKAGGIVAIIAGIFGIFAAGATLFMGGMGAAFEADGANTVIGLGWGGVLFSFLAIVLGAVVMGASTRLPGVLLIVCSIAGAVLGGTLVAVFMFLSLIGGLLAVIGAKSKIEPALLPGHPSPGLGPPPLPAAAAGKMSIVTKVVLWVGGIFVGLIILGALIGPLVEQNRTQTGADPAASGEAAPTSAPPPPAAPSPKIGDKFDVGNVEAQILSVSVTTSVGSDFTLKQASDGGQFVAVRWKYKNITREPIGPFSTPSLFLVDPSGIKYEADIDASSSFASQLNEDAKVLSDLNPGISVTDSSVFEVSRELYSDKYWRLLVRGDRDAFVALDKGQSEPLPKPAVSQTQPMEAPIDVRAASVEAPPQAAVEAADSEIIDQPDPMTDAKPDGYWEEKAAEAATQQLEDTMSSGGE